jgi:Mn-containing catalase
MDDIEGNLPVDGGDGQASVQLAGQEMKDYAAMSGRLTSDPNASPATGADLGGGPGAGKLSDEDMGGAQDMTEAKTMSRAISAEYGGGDE